MQRDDRKKRINKINKKVRKLGKELSRLQEEARSEERLKSKQDTQAFIHNAGTWKLPMRKPNKLIGWPDASDALITTQKDKDKKRAREQAAAVEKEDLSYHAVFHIEELRLMILDRMGPMELAMIHATNKQLQQAVISSFPVLFECWVKRLEAPLMKSVKQSFTRSITLLRKIKQQYADCPPLILPHLHSVFSCYRSYGPFEADVPNNFRDANPPIDNVFTIVHDKKEHSYRPATEYGHFAVANYREITLKRGSSFYNKEGFSVPSHAVHDYLRYKDYTAMALQPISTHSINSLVVVSNEEMVVPKDNNDRLAYYHLVTNESLATRVGSVLSTTSPFIDLYECRSEIALCTGNRSVFSRYAIAKRPGLQAQILKLNENLAKKCLC